MVWHSPHTLVLPKDTVQLLVPPTQYNVLVLKSCLLPIIVPWLVNGVRAMKAPSASPPRITVSFFIGFTFSSFCFLQLRFNFHCATRRQGPPRRPTETAQLRRPASVENRFHSG